MEKVVTLINPLGESGSAPVNDLYSTSRGEKVTFLNGDYTTTDKGKARDLQERYPYLLDADHEIFNPTHHMRVTTVGVPWGRYDELGRRLPDDVDSKNPA